MQFVDSNFELESNYSDFIAPQDVSTYGGLCTLASFNRAELKVNCNAVIFNVMCCRNFLSTALRLFWLSFITLNIRCSVI
jgi:COP9 signalosome complex subunit 1